MLMCILVFRRKTKRNKEGAVELYEGFINRETSENKKQDLNNERETHILERER